ncbi:MAG TPA: DUF4129 domain-containing protein [Polyangiaceae bacterium]
MKAHALVLAGALACGAAAWAPPALAVMDPAQAQADVDAAMRAHAYTFCRAPHEPLSGDALALCPHASSIPDCSGYAAACAKMTTPPSWSLPSWWGMFALPPFLGVLFQVLMWLVVAALVLAILVPVVAAIVRYRRRDDAKAKKEEKPSAAAPERLAELVASSDEEALLARADELAARGEYGAALQLYLAAGLRALDKRGAVRIARDRTNGEYVRACADAQAKPALREIVREVDQVQFGGQPATREAASRAAQRAMAIVKAVPLAILVVLLPLVLGCSGAASLKPRVAGDDPAGGELLRDVLRAQGVTAKDLDSSLATMPLPAAGELTPAVIVDVEQTSIDDDTRAHLASWVDAGGVLVLAGSPTQWPKEFGASYAWATGPRKITARRLLARAVEAEPGEEDDGDDDSESAIYARTEEHGVLATDRGLKFKGPSENIAWFDDKTTYAAVVAYGKGRVLCMASDELLTNAGIAHPGNAAALVAILAATSRSDVRIADPEDGVSPPSTPIAALLRAGLGMGLLHAVPFILVLFVGAGTRLSRPRPSPPPRRRAFAEHVAAVGALYARTHNGAHALAAYARFADERLRARMPRGSTDVGGFLASRAGMPLDVSQRLWARAMQAKAGAPPLGDELSVLRELSVVYAAAMQQER